MQTRAFGNQRDKPLRSRKPPDVSVLVPSTHVLPVLHKKTACACGGGCLRCQRNASIENKVAVSQPDDAYEEEADRLADQVMRMAEPQELGAGTSGDPAHTAVSAAARRVLDGPGEALDSGTRAFMESRFGHDFSRVRVHADSSAAASARGIQAKAYTVGDHIAFGAGHYAPHTTAGQRLLAHELAHVVQTEALASQQGGTAVQGLPVLREAESDEEEARRRQALSSLDWLAAIPPIVMDENAPLLIRWAVNKEAEFHAPETTDERRRYIAGGLLRVFKTLKEFEARAPREADGALLYRNFFDVAVPWTEDRARGVEELSPFTAESVATWRAASARPARRGKQTAAPASGSAGESPLQAPERKGFALNATFRKQPGMTLNTEEGQRLIMRYVIAGTRSGYSADELDWAVSQLSLEKRWAPPAGMDLGAWQESFEAIPEGGEVTLTVTESFTLELDEILRNTPTQRDFLLEGYRQGVVDARAGLYLGIGTFAVGTLALGGGALLGTALAAGGGGIGAAGAALGRQALYWGRQAYLNAPKLYGEAMFWTGWALSTVSLSEHVREIRGRGFRWSDLPRVAEDLSPFAGGYMDWTSFRGPSAPRPSIPPDAPEPNPPSLALSNVPRAPAAPVRQPSVPVRPLSPSGGVDAPEPISIPLPLLSSKPPANQNFANDIRRARHQRAAQAGMPQAADVEAQQPLALTGTDDVTGVTVSGTTKPSPGLTSSPVAIKKGATPGSGTPTAGSVRTSEITARPKGNVRAPVADDDHPTVPEDRPRGGLFNRTARELDELAAQRERGITFDTERSGAWPHNQVRVEHPDAKGRYVILDSYDPGVAIVSRKYPADARPTPKQLIDNLEELVNKYPQGARILDTPQNRQAGIAGQRLRGQHVLEVPVLLKDIPEHVLELARRLHVVIIDPEGNTYWASRRLQ